MFESMSAAGRAWYDRILRDEFRAERDAERDRAIHNERSTAQAERSTAQAERSTAQAKKE